MELNILSNGGGMGDQIARCTAIKAMLDQTPHLYIRLFVYSSLLEVFTLWFKDHPQVREVVAIEDKRTPSLIDGKEGIEFKAHVQYQLGIHPVDFSYIVLLQRLPTPEDPKEYLKIEHPKRKGGHIGITPNFTAPNRSLPPEVWNEVIEGIKARGYVPVVFGSASNKNFKTKAMDGLNLKGCLDMRDRTTILEAAQGMGQCDVVIGLDNGLMHLAACTTTPLVIAYTTQKAYNRVPYRKEPIYTIDASSECNACEIKMRYNKGQDFRYCFTKTEECIKTITSSVLLEGLDKVLQDARESQVVE